MKTIKDKLVIVTGASSGIGLACAKLFAEKGARVVFAARNGEKISPLIHALRDKGSTVSFIKTDIREEEECKRMIDRTLDLYGSPDVLINNAGISMRAIFNDTKPFVIKEVMDTNFWGTIYCTRYALPHLINNKGSLISISSVTGKAPLPARTGYCASKYAVEGFMEALRLENKHNGLHVMVVRPGFTRSNIRLYALNKDGLPQGESPRIEENMMTAEEVALSILKGIYHRKREFTLTPEGKFTVALYKLFPSLADKLICKFMESEINIQAKEKIYLHEGIIQKTRVFPLERKKRIWSRLIEILP